MLLLLPLAAGAKPLTIDVQPVRSSVYLNQSATYNLNIYNPNTNPIGVYLIFPDLQWVGFTDPLADYAFTLNASKGKQTRLTFYPKQSLMPGPYTINLVINDQTDNTHYTLTLPVYLRASTPGSGVFAPSARMSLKTPFEVDPRSPWTVNVSMENLNPKTLSNLTLVVSSPLVREEKTVTLQGNGESTVVFALPLDPYTPSQDGTLHLQGTYVESNRTYSWEDNAPYRIISYKDMVQNRTVQTSFLKTVTTISLANRGNGNDIAEVTEPTSTFRNLFSSFAEQPDYVKAPTGDYYSWNVPLSPKGTATISYTTDYRPLFYLAVLLVLVFALYYLLRSPLVIKKDVSKLATREGGISSIKIILQIKNRTNRSYENIRVFEKLPHIVNIEESFEIGTIEPASITKGAKTGTLVKWEFSHIDAHEERLITYKIESKLSILGGISLPPTLVRFQDRQGREVTVKSNRLNLEL